MQVSNVISRHLAQFKMKGADTYLALEQVDAHAAILSKHFLWQHKGVFYYICAFEVKSKTLFKTCIQQDGKRKMWLH